MHKYFTFLILVVIVMALIFFALSVKVLFVKGGRFPDTSVGGNKHLRKKGIYCPKTHQKIIDNQIKSNSKQNCDSCSDDCALPENLRNRKKIDVT